MTRVTTTHAVPFCAATFGLCLLSSSAAAQSSPDIGDWLSRIKMSSEYSIGVMSGRAQEYVYRPDGSVLSRLDWTFKNISMFNAKTSAQLLPWLSVGLRSSLNLSGDAAMKDIDINLPNCPPTATGTYCESNSPTRLRHASMLDASAVAQFYEAAGISLSAIVGYKRDQFRWDAIGGTANYGPTGPGYQISYEQRWSTPYVGLGMAYRSGAWTANGRVIGSSWAKGDDRDNHYNRSLLFTEDFAKTRFLGADVGLAYRLNPYVSVTADYRYQMWGLGKGPVTTVNLKTGATAVEPNAAGANATSHTVSVGFKVDFQPSADAAAPSAAAVARSSAWSGWYLGVAGGIEAQRDTWTTTGLGTGAAAFAATVERPLNGDVRQRAGLFGGYNALFGATLLGIEADIGKSNKSVTKVGIPGTGTLAAQDASTDSIHVHANLDASLRARVGLLLNPTLLAYATGGLAMEQIEAGLTCNATAPPPGASPGDPTGLWCKVSRYEAAAKWRTGWTAGLGYEFNFAGNWFTRGEYRYTHMSAASTTFFANAPIDAVQAKIDPADHRLTFGVGTRF